MTCNCVIRTKLCNDFVPGLIFSFTFTAFLISMYIIDGALFIFILTVINVIADILLLIFYLRKVHKPEDLYSSKIQLDTDDYIVDIQNDKHTIYYNSDLDNKNKEENYDEYKDSDNKNEEENQDEDGYENRDKAEESINNRLMSWVNSLKEIKKNKMDNEDEYLIRPILRTDYSKNKRNDNTSQSFLHRIEQELDNKTLNDCSICLSYPVYPLLIVPCCQTIFCEECLREWFEFDSKNFSCPNCRCNLSGITFPKLNLTNI